MKHKEFRDLLEKKMNQSEYLMKLDGIGNEISGEALSSHGIRQLTHSEIKDLETLNNRAESWDRIYVTNNFIPQNIRNTEFTGTCVLGRFTGAGVDLPCGISLHTGIYSCRISDSKILDDAVMYDCNNVARAFIMKGAVLYGCSSLFSTGDTSFGNGTLIHTGVEEQGRHIRSCSDMDMETARKIVLGKSDTSIQKTYNEFIDKYTSRAVSHWSVVSEDAVLISCGIIRNSYIGSAARIQGVSRIDNSSVISTGKKRVELSEASLVDSSVIMHGARVTSKSILKRTILMSDSHVYNLSVINDSILGDNTHINNTLIQRSLIGRNTKTSGKSVVVSGIWPDGRCETGTGVNAAPDNSVRAFDQEMFSTHGLFLGNGSIIRYPCDLSHSPYTAVAPGVELIPQRISCPFSLVSGLSKHIPDIPQHYNEIVPGYLLSPGLYNLVRREAMYTENLRDAGYFHTIFTKRTVDLMMDIRDRLKGVSRRKAYYTSEDFPGLGRNILLEKKRQKAVSLYNMYISYALLTRLYLQTLKRGGLFGWKWDDNETGEDIKGWKYWVLLLDREGLMKNGIKRALTDYSSLCIKISNEVARSRETIDRKDSSLIADYNETMVLADRDELIVSIKEEAFAVKDNIVKMLGD